MRKIRFIFALMIGLAGIAPAAAQFAEALTPCHGCTPEEAAHVAKLHAASPVAIGGPVGTPTVAKGGGFIQIGAVFGDFLQPYIDAAIQAILAALVGWVCIRIQKRTGIEIDQQHRDAFTKALSNQASSLVADGMVRIENEKIDVSSPALAAAADQLMKTVPDAAKHFGLTPAFVAERIIDTIPQIAAGAQLIAGKAKAALP